MKQKMKRIMAGFLALLTVFTTLPCNGTTAFAANSSANIAFWYASTRASGEVSELKAGYDHGKILYVSRLFCSMERRTHDNRGKDTVLPKAERNDLKGTW